MPALSPLNLNLIVVMDQIYEIQKELTGYTTMRMSLTTKIDKFLDSVDEDITYLSDPEYLKMVNYDKLLEQLITQDELQLQQLNSQLEPLEKGVEDAAKKSGELKYVGS